MSSASLQQKKNIKCLLHPFIIKSLWITFDIQRNLHSMGLSNDAGSDISSKQSIITAILCDFFSLHHWYEWNVGYTFDNFSWLLICVRLYSALISAASEGKISDKRLSSFDTQNRPVTWIDCSQQMKVFRHLVLTT